MASRRNRPRDQSKALCRPVRAPASAIISRKRESARPVNKASDVPTTDHRVHESICRSKESRAPSKRHEVVEIGRDRVSCIEIGNAAVSLDVPGVNNAAEVLTLVVVSALRVGSEVDRFGKHVVELKLEAVSHGVAERELCR